MMICGLSSNDDDGNSSDDDADDDNGGNHCIAIFSLLIVIFSLHAVLSTSIIFSFFLSSGKHVDLLCVFEQTDMIVLISWHCF